jgi:hypothetical protein
VPTDGRRNITRAFHGTDMPVRLRAGVIRANSAAVIPSAIFTDFN